MVISGDNALGYEAWGLAYEGLVVISGNNSLGYKSRSLAYER